MGERDSVKPDVSALCAAGERAFDNDDFEEALEWYELACVGVVCASPSDLTDRRHARLAELRRMLPWRSVHRQPASDGHVLAVMTCAGRERFLDRTYASLRNAGLSWWRGKKILVTDGGAPRDPWPGWHVSASQTRLGQAQTFFRALREAASSPTLTALTLLEDDVVLARNALDYIAATKIDDDLGFLSWFSVETCTIPRLLPIVSCRRATTYQFNQAITFPVATVRELLGSKALQTWGEPHGADRLYERVFPDRYVGWHYPNLVQHVGGKASTVGNDSHGERVSPTFIGEDADALDLW